MQEFVFVYRLPQEYVAQGESTTAWQSWFESMGPGLLDLGKPAIAAGTVGHCSEGVRVGGFSLVAAESLEQALEIAGRCPALLADGGVEVGELREVS